MPRRNLRNFTTVFNQMDLDFSGRGLNVSEDIQLTYNMGDWERYTQTQLGGAGFTFKEAGTSGFLQVEVLAPKGMIFWSIQDQAPIVNNENNNAWLTRTQSFGVTSADENEPAGIRGFGIVAGAAPLSRLTRGHTTDAKTGLVQQRGTFGTGLYTQALYAGTPGLWVREGQFLVVHCNTTNQRFSPYLICSEVGRDASPPV